MSRSAAQLLKGPMDLSSRQQAEFRLCQIGGALCRSLLNVRLSKALSGAVLVSSVANPGFAGDATKIDALWSEYVSNCTGAFINPQSSHTSPAEMFGIDTVDVDLWARSEDGALVDFAGYKHNEAHDLEYGVSFVSNKIAEQYISHSCGLSFEGSLGSRDAISQEIKALFAEKDMEVFGGPYVPAEGSSESLDGDDVWVEFMVAQSLSGSVVITHITFNSYELTFEHDLFIELQ